MLKRCGRLFGLVRVSSRESNSNPRRDFSRAGSASLGMSLNFPEYSSLSSNLKDVSVRIIHAGGREELYQNSVSVAQVMEKYPGMCVALPEVFRKPYESILGAEDKLLVGHKYFIIPSTTVKKLKRRHLAKRKGGDRRKDNKPAQQKTISLDRGRAGDFSEESVGSAKDFYVPKERFPESSSRKKVMRKKPFVPPIQKARAGRSMTWEPSLSSVQELSP